MQKHTPESNETPRYDRSQNSPISSEHDLTHDVVTSWPAISDQNFQNMCQINKKESSESFVAIRRFLRELFEKYRGGPSDSPPLQVRGLNSPTFLLDRKSVV